MFFKSTFLLPVLSFVSIQSVSLCEDALPRRVQLGTQVQPVSEETRKRLGLRNLRGVEIVSGQIEQEIVLQSTGWHYLGYEKMAPDDIAERHAELIGWVEQNWTDGKYFSGIHYKFFQQLCKTNVAEAWEAFVGPVLSLWGEGDIVTSAEDHEFLASIANRKQQGKGEFKKLPGVEHNLRLVPSVEPATEMLVRVVDEWSKRILIAKDDR